MSYEKMMRWNKKHRKGISYKKGWVGFHSTSGFTPSIAWLENAWWPYVERCKKLGATPVAQKEFYMNERYYNELLDGL